MKRILFMIVAPLVAANVNYLPCNSSNFSTSDWRKSHVQSGAGAMTGPDGFSQAQSLDDIPDPSYQVHLMQTASSVPFSKNTNTASVSIYLHPGALHQVVLVNLFNSGGQNGAITARVDLNTGYVINTSTDCCAPFTSFSTTVADAGNGWRRVGVSVTARKGQKIDSVTPILQIEQPSGGPYIDTVGQTGILYLWGLQVDPGATPMPYQPVL